MAVRTLKIFLILLVFCLAAGTVSACFGPKLFLGVPEDANGRVLTSIVSIYIKEKTGVETERVDLAGKDLIAEISAERLDYGFAERSEPDINVVMEVTGLPYLVSGPRILDNIQFTTVAPALTKLQRLLTPDIVQNMRRKVEAGEPPMVVARRFMMQQRWI
ncbi:MAG: hypothetical protein C0623_12485 [Desulfuromonas sp.]|nr:MAG: hypothetical protein C0623_12485 [Desulfuromonas sp.]